MPQDQIEDQPKPARSGSARLVTAGVVGACALGIGLGLWARPQAVEQGDKPAAVETETAADRAPTRKMRIVVDNTPAPVGQPLEVLPAETPRGMSAPVVRELLPAPPIAIEPLVPRRPPTGLMKVASPEPLEPLMGSREPPKPKARPAVVARSKAEKPKSSVAKAETPRKKDVRVARADGPATKKSDAKRKASQRTETAATRSKTEVRLAALVRAVRHAPAKLKGEARTAERRKAKPDRVAAASRKPPKEKAKKAAVARAQAEPRRAKPAPRGEGPMRVAKNNTCASADPGEALVCGNGRLSVRERQLQRAYRDAEAAGVPASELARQQRRWLAARAAAAREAPWAVEEVYEARIAELNDLSRRN